MEERSRRGPTRGIAAPVVDLSDLSVTAEAAARLNVAYPVSPEIRTGKQNAGRPRLVDPRPTAEAATLRDRPRLRVPEPENIRARAARGMDRVLAGSALPWVRPSVDLVALLVVTLGLALGGQVHGTATLAHHDTVLAYPFIVVSLMWARGSYTSRPRRSIVDSTAAALGVSALAFTIYVTATTVGGVDVADLSTATLVAVACAAALAATTVSFDLLWRWAWRRGRLAKRTVIVGAGLVGSRIAERLRQRPEYGLMPIAMVDAEPESGSGSIPLVGVPHPEDLVETARMVRADHVVLAFSQTPDSLLVEHVRRCALAGIEVSVVPRLFESVNGRFELQRIGALPLMVLNPVDPSSWQFSLKYALDRALALVLLIALAPLLLAVAAAVKLSSPGPVLFRQRRVSRDGRTFDLLKFRSMYWSTERALFEPPPGLAPGGVEGADRRTPLGRFLRRTFVDELPQLVNILRGDMSLVGPRPERPEFVELFNERVERYGDRHRTKSGVTGWAQVHGLRGQTSLADRIELDNYYIENWSFGLDLKILMMTAIAVVFNRRDR